MKRNAQKYHVPYERSSREREANIGVYCADKGLSVKELAVLAGVSTGSIYMLDSGMTSPIQEYGKLAGGPKKTALAIAKALEVDFADLFPRYVCKLNTVNSLTDDQLMFICGIDIPDNQEAELGRKELWSLVESVVTDREFDIIKRHLIEGMTFDEVGTRYDVGGERVRQIELKAFRRLNRPEYLDELRSYLTN